MSHESELEAENKELKNGLRRADERWRSEISQKIEEGISCQRECMANTQKLLTKLTDDVSTIKKEVAEVRTTVYGGGGDNDPGLKLKVDRLQSRVAIMWLPVTAAFTAAGAWAWSKLTGGKP